MPGGLKDLRFAFSRPRALLIGLSLLMCVAAARAQQLNPFEGDAAAVTAGGALYAGRCADCHGADAKGSRGPDLTQRWANGDTDESMFAKIRAGVPGSIMPPSSAPDHELWAIVAYLRSISVAPQLVSSGDPARGRVLFLDECQECHRVGAEGGALGPDLTQIGLVRSREALVTALREPSANVPAGFHAVELVSDGRRIEGVVKAEDAFSIQVLAMDGRLLGYAKAELTKLTPREESLMPVYSRDKLGDAALEDLLAYLGTLRTGAK
jgi:putative heme-binding domain-containing protein